MTNKYLLYKTKTSLARELKINRQTINTKITNGDIKLIYNTRGEKYYIETRKGLQYLIND